MDTTLKRDIVEWDIYNWSRALDFWESEATEFVASFIEKNECPKVLDLGGRNGGVSLFWALKGCNVVWSDIDKGSVDNAKALHDKYGVSSKVTYEFINSLDIPYENEFDIICLKSMIGAVYGECGGAEAVKQMFAKIEKALKPGGCLFIAENLEGSSLHMFLRKKLRKWGSIWHYFKVKELVDYLLAFKDVRYDCFGLIGLFGRGAFLSRLFSSFDRKFDHKVKENKRYIISLVCRKK